MSTGDIPPRSWITCRAGHHICFTEEGVRVGQHMNEWAARLTDWQQHQPKVGERIDPKCEKCSAPWWPVQRWEAADV